MKYQNSTVNIKSIK